MTHARHADPAVPLTAIYFLAAALAAVVLITVVAVTTLEPFGFGARGEDLPGVSPAVVDSGIQWELERRQQYGYVDPVVESGDQWERERRQYGFVDPITESGDRWEEERREQSGS
jgi:hypothetical protein